MSHAPACTVIEPYLSDLAEPNPRMFPHTDAYILTQPDIISSQQNIMAEASNPSTPRRSPRLAVRAASGIAPAISPISIGLPPRPLGSRRSHAAIVAERKRALPDGFPAGPFADFSDAKIQIERHIKNPRIGGGAFAATWSGGTIPATRNAGEKKKLVCDRHKKPKAATGSKANKNTGCSWNLVLEDSQEGIVVKDFDGQDHNHDLAESRAEMNAQSSLRFIPDDLVEVGQMLKAAGQSPADINDVLQKAAKTSGRDVTWNYQDVRNKYAYTAEDKLMDATNLDKYLSERRDRGLYYAMYHGDDSNGGRHLSRVCFEMEGARDIWAQEECPEIISGMAPSRGISALYDTTFNTNRGGLKLGLVIGVDQEGLTRILFVSMVLYQGAKDFEWVFEHLLECFRVDPNVIFTDSDPAMASAIAKVLPLTIHLLCTWHLSLNLSTNVQPATGKNAFEAVRKKWWNICKTSDLLSINTFEQEWKELQDTIPVPPMEPHEKYERYKTAMAWLDKCAGKREMWAARWTWRHMTVGVHSTQRSESQHNAIKKKIIKASCLMLHCCQQLTDYAGGVETREAASVAKKIIDKACTNVTSNLPCVTNLEKELSLHALDVLKGQQAQVLAYKVCFTGQYVDHRAPGQQQQSSAATRQQQQAGQSATEGQQQQQQSSSAAQQQSSSAAGQQQQVGQSAPEGQQQPAQTSAAGQQQPAQSSSTGQQQQQQAGQSALGAQLRRPLFQVYRGQEDTHMTIDERICEDHHLQDQSMTVRFTTESDCTCQFQSCWGLPCRHMLALYLQMGKDKVPEGVVAERWKKKSAQDVVAARRKLLQQLPGSLQVRAQTTTDRPWTDRDRYSYIVSESKAVCEHASKSDVGVEILIKHLHRAKQEIAQEITAGQPSSSAVLINNPPHKPKRGRPEGRRIESSGKKRP